RGGTAKLRTPRSRRALAMRCDRGGNPEERSPRMSPQPALNLVPTVQQAITNLLTTYEPEFLRFGYNLFLSFAVILIAWQGFRVMFSHEGLNDQLFDFAK